MTMNTSAKLMVAVVGVASILLNKEESSFHCELVRQTAKPSKHWTAVKEFKISYHNRDEAMWLLGYGMLKISSIMGYNRDV